MKTRARSNGIRLFSERAEWAKVGHLITFLDGLSMAAVEEGERGIGV